MNSEQQALWLKIREFDIDGGPASLSFSKRLARENGWSHAYAARVVEEYKRFVFLCMEAGHKCTPSDEVDQAWHLHLVYTESYWSRMCGEILPRPLHHGPTKGGQAEDDKFVDWYERTKDSYLRLFGFQPSADIWPDSATRFANAGAWQRIDTSRYWLVPRRALRLAGLASLLLVSLAGCGAMSGDAVIGLLFCIFFTGVLVIAIFASVKSIASPVTKNRDGSSGCGADVGGGCGSGSGCSSGCGSGCGGGGCGGGCGG